MSRLVFVAALLLCFSGLTPARAEIIIPPDRPLASDVRAARLDLELDRLPDVWSKEDRAAPWFDDWKALRVEFVQSQIRMPSREQMLEMTRRIVAVRNAGCRDPLATLALGVWEDSSYDNGSAAGLLTSALRTLSTWEYSSIWEARALLAQIEVAPGRRKNSMQTQIGVAYADALAAGDYDDPTWGARIFFAEVNELIRTTLPTRTAETLVDRVIDSGRAEPWLVHMLNGVLERRRAWDARGGGYAYTVTDEGWRGFRKHIARGQRHYLDAHELNPDRPEAAAALVAAAMASEPINGLDERGWFDLAVAAQPDFKEAYTNYMWALQPRWGGTVEDLFSFATECLDTQRFDTGIPSQGLIAVKNALVALDEIERAQVAGVAVDLVERIVTGIHTTPYGKSWRAFYSSHVIATAVACNDWETATTWFRIGDDLHNRMFRDLDLHTIETRDELRIRRAGLYDSVVVAWSAMDEDNLDAVIEALQLIQVSTDDEKAHFALQEQLYVATMLRDFETGEPVRLTSDDRLSGWRAVAGQWRATANGDLIASPDARGCRIFNTVPFGGRYRLTGEYESRSMRNSRAGVMFASWHGPQTDSIHSAMVLTDRNASGGHVGPDLPKPTSSRGGRGVRRFEIVAWDGEYMVLFNGEPAIDEVLHLPDRSSETIGLAIASKARGAVGRFSNLVIKKLDVRPDEFASEVQP